jgi:hypothetical protein
MPDQPTAICPLSTVPASKYPFDGKWKVLISSTSGCSNNKSRSIFIGAKRRMIDEPHQPIPRKGSNSENGDFIVSITEKSGKQRGIQSGNIDVDIGKGSIWGGENRGAKERSHWYVSTRDYQLPVIRTLFSCTSLFDLNRIGKG